MWEIIVKQSAVASYFCDKCMYTAVQNICTEEKATSILSTVFHIFHLSSPLPSPAFGGGKAMFNLSWKKEERYIAPEQLESSQDQGSTGQHKWKPVTALKKHTHYLPEEVRQCFTVISQLHYNKTSPGAVSPKQGVNTLEVCKAIHGSAGRKY